MSVGTVFSGVGFASALVSSIVVAQTRQIIWPLVDQSGQPIQDPNAPPGSTPSGIIGGYVAILEEHRDELEITKHPVEQGATIADHAFKMPIEVTIEIGWSPSSFAYSGLPSLFGATAIPFSGVANSALSLFGLGTGGSSVIKQTYQRMLMLQAQRTLVTIYTGKRRLDNMLIRMVTERTTKETENVLILNIALEQIIIAKVSTVTVPTNPDAQKNPQDTTPTSPQGNQNLQPGSSYNDVGPAHA